MKRIEMLKQMFELLAAIEGSLRADSEAAIRGLELNLNSDKKAEKIAEVARFARCKLTCLDLVGLLRNLRNQLPLSDF